jgi:hypothetical protein
MGNYISLIFNVKKVRRSFKICEWLDEKHLCNIITNYNEVLNYNTTQTLSLSQLYLEISIDEPNASKQQLT